MTDHPTVAVDGGASEIRMVVGVGASAGGVAALKKLFERVPRGSGCAWVVILHLSPDYGRLTEVLQCSTELHVAQVVDSAELAGDHIYVIPPRKSLTATARRLVLSDIEHAEERRSPIDMFLRALAESQRTRAAAVILSGTGPNGSRGLKRVKEYGGLVVAQDPGEAEHDGMPRHAIATGLVDFVLPVADIPEAIFTYARGQEHSAIGRASTKPVPALASRVPAPSLSFHVRGRDSLAPGDLHLRLLEELAPPSILISSEQEVLHVSASAGRFLRLAGAPSRDLFKLIGPDLRVDLRAALDESSQLSQGVEIPHARVHVDGREERVRIFVKRIVGEDDPARGFFLLFFQSHPDAAPVEERLQTLSTGEEAAQHGMDAWGRDAKALLDAEVAQRTSELRAEVIERLAAEGRVRNLVRQLVTAQEDERARIARDLHDQMGQQLTALRLALERHQERVQTSDDHHEDLARAQALVKEIDNGLEFLASELRPPALDDLGLAVVLPRYVKEWSHTFGIGAEFRGNSLGEMRLPREAELTFYRVAQEALTNVAKHAKASQVGVLLERRDHMVTLIIEDDGVGFEPSVPEQATGLGLIGMRERALLIGASLDVESSPTHGTTVYLRLPYPAV